MVAFLKGDMFVPRERGRAQSLYGLGPLLGPVCGTIAGGWIAQALHSWRWLLGTLTIVSCSSYSTFVNASYTFNVFSLSALCRHPPDCFDISS